MLIFPLGLSRPRDPVLGAVEDAVDAGRMAVPIEKAFESICSVALCHAELQRWKRFRST